VRRASRAGVAVKGRSAVSINEWYALLSTFCGGYRAFTPIGYWHDVVMVGRNLSILRLSTARERSQRKVFVFEG
jgi:hypothetical protein